MNTTITRTSLYFREGNSDKEYHVAIEPEGEGYHVTYAYGRRGNTLTTGSKTRDIVDLAEATSIHDKLVRRKMAKGYRPADGEDQNPATIAHARDSGGDTGIRCQLLNPVDEDQVPRLLTDTRHCLQEKHDGRRLMVRKTGGGITGVNRRGLVVSVPTAIREAVAKLPVDALLDGEVVGGTYHVFDLLELDGRDIRSHGYLGRHAGLLALLPPACDALLWVSTAIDPDDKVATYRELRHANREGVVFKDIDAPYSPGRPASGGSQLKYKFVETASFVVSGLNRVRSVSLGLYGTGEESDALLPTGNVTIPPNRRVPRIGAVVEVRYLHAFPESGSIYQPVYLHERNDIPAADCTTEQLKYKPGTAPA